jgi:hypothetical protein
MNNELALKDPNQNIIEPSSGEFAKPAAPLRSAVAPCEGLRDTAVLRGISPCGDAPRSAQRPRGELREIATPHLLRRFWAGTP